MVVIEVFTPVVQRILKHNMVSCAFRLVPCLGSRSLCFFPSVVIYWSVNAQCAASCPLSVPMFISLSVPGLWEVP